MGLEEAIGLGVTVTLVDMFRKGASGVVESMHHMESEVVGGAGRVTAAIHSMETGMVAMGAGGVVLGGLAALGSHAVEETLKVNGLRSSITALANDGGRLAEEMDRLSDQSGVFDPEQFGAAAKQLLGMGTAAERIPGMLTAASQAAAVLGGGIDEMASGFYNIQFAMESGMNPTRALKRFGVTLADLAALGIKESKGKITSSMDDVMTAVQTAIGQRFGERAGAIAEGVGAMKKQLSRAITEGFVAAGEPLVAAEKGILAGVLEVARAGAEEIGAQFGAGLSSVYTLLSPIGRGLKDAALGLVSFLKEHPEIVRIGVALAGVVAVVLVGVGAVMALGGAVRLLPFAIKLATEAMSTGLASIGSALTMLPMLIGIAALAYIVYQAWTQNIGGIRDTLTRWYESARLVVEGLWELFTSSSHGVGAIPSELQQKLMDRGLWPLVQQLFVWGERIGDVFSGIWEGVKETLGVVIEILGVLGSVVGWVIGWVVKGIAWFNDLTGATAKLSGGTQEASTWFHRFGDVIGFVVGMWAVYRAGLIAYQVAAAAAKIATALWTPEQWSLNAAMDANPIGLIVIAIAAVIVAIVLLIKHYDDLQLSSYETARAIRAAFGADTTAHDQLIAALKLQMHMKGLLAKREEEQGSGGFAGMMKSAGLTGGGPRPGSEGTEPTADAAAAPRLPPYIAAMAAQGAGATGGGGGVDGKRETTVNLHLNGKMIHQVVVDEENNARERDVGAG
jgi:hypothetical protein